MNIKQIVAEYQTALEASMELSHRETTLKVERVAARHRLNLAKDALRALESDLHLYVPDIEHKTAT